MLRVSNHQCLEEVDTLSESSGWLERVWVWGDIRPIATQAAIIGAVILFVQEVWASKQSTEYGDWHQKFWIALISYLGPWEHIRLLHNVARKCIIEPAGLLVKMPASKAERKPLLALLLVSVNLREWWTMYSALKGLEFLFHHLPQLYKNLGHFLLLL